MIEPINSSSKFWEMERGHVTSSSNRLSRDQVMTFHAFGCHTQRNVKAVHVENHVRKNLGRTIISGSDFLSHQTPTMFTGVDFLHSRIFYIMSKCHDLQKKNKTPVIAPFFVPCPKYLRPHVLCGQGGLQGNGALWHAKYLSETSIWTNSGGKGAKKRPNQKWMETNWRPKQCYQDNHKLWFGVLSLEVFRFFCELEAFWFSPAVGSVSSMLFLLRAPRGTERWREICFAAIFVAFCLLRLAFSWRSSPASKGSQVGDGGSRDAQWITCPDVCGLGTKGGLLITSIQYTPKFIKHVYMQRSIICAHIFNVDHGSQKFPSCAEFSKVLM